MSAQVHTITFGQQMAFKKGDRHGWRHLKGKAVQEYAAKGEGVIVDRDCDLILTVMDDKYIYGHPVPGEGEGKAKLLRFVERPTSTTYVDLKHIEGWVLEASEPKVVTQEHWDAVMDFLGVRPDARPNRHM